VKKPRYRRHIIPAFVTYILAILYLAPFYITFTYAFRSGVDIVLNPIGFPSSLFLDNFKKALEIADIFTAMKNSFIVTVFTVIIVVLLCSMAGYVLCRNRNKKVYYALYLLFTFSIFLPFQTVMFPVYKQAFDYGYLNTLYGLTSSIIAFNCGLFIFMYSGFVNTVPLELEEAARIDGCSRLRSFWQITFPLLKPIHISVAVIAALSGWNDFIISLVMVHQKPVRTLQLMQFYFIGQNTQDPPAAFAAFTLALIPVLVFYIFMQKYIEKGITAGALKG